MGSLDRACSPFERLCTSRDSCVRSAACLSPYIRTSQVEAREGWLVTSLGGPTGGRTDSVLDCGVWGGPQACKPRKPRMYRSMYGAMYRFGNPLQPRLCQPPQLWQKITILPKKK